MKCFKPEVVKCQVDSCSFNQNQICHALGINVGGPHQECDTFIKAGNKAGSNLITSSVGACKVPNCRFNNMMLCEADAVSVGWHGEHADCLTFSEKN